MGRYLIAALIISEAEKITPERIGVEQFRKWNGGVRRGPEHQEIVAIYNAQAKLPRGYKLTLSDAYCAGTASALLIVMGITEFTGTECSCAEFIEIARTKGIWQERDDYDPAVGDFILYDWEDQSTGYKTADNKGAPNHIGMVIEKTAGGFIVGEGNTNNGKIATRTMAVNGRSGPMWASAPTEALKRIIPATFPTLIL